MYILNLNEVIDQFRKTFGPRASHRLSKKARAAENARLWREVAKDPGSKAKFEESLGGGEEGGHWLRNAHELLLEWEVSGANNSFTATTGSKAGDLSSYGEVMARLFTLEFSPAKKVDYDDLATTRRLGVRLALCRQLALTAYNGVSTALNPSIDRFFPLSGEYSGYNAHLGPYVAAYDTTPTYLWNTQEKRTYVTSELKDKLKKRPAYTVISHTWGSRQKAEAPWIQLPNVLWELPQIESFSVEDLPGMLEKLPWEWVWMDLLCVPQGVDLSAEAREGQQMEIERQPAIFRAAERAVVWFDDMERWETLSGVVRYLSLNDAYTAYLSGYDESAWKQKRRAAFDEADRPLELLERGNASDPLLPNVWFRSVWALREACVRPNMLLCNKQWEFLEIAPQTPVQLCDIVALVGQYRRSQSSRQEAPPRGVDELVRMLERTGVDMILELDGWSSTIVLQDGDARICADLTMPGIDPFTTSRPSEDIEAR